MKPQRARGETETDAGGRTGSCAAGFETSGGSSGEDLAAEALFSRFFFSKMVLNRKVSLVDPSGYVLWLQFTARLFMTFCLVLMHSAAFILQRSWNSVLCVRMCVWVC